MIIDYLEKEFTIQIENMAPFRRAEVISLYKGVISMDAS